MYKRYFGVILRLVLVFDRQPSFSQRGDPGFSRMGLLFGMRL
jgi:hypothetical protein